MNEIHEALEKAFRAFPQQVLMQCWQSVKGCEKQILAGVSHWFRSELLRDREGVGIEGQCETDPSSSLGQRATCSSLAAAVLVDKPRVVKWIRRSVSDLKEGIV